MFLHLHPYPPHRDTMLQLPETGLACIYGLNGAGKSSFVEAYAAAVWGRSLRGASPWRSPECRMTLSAGGYTVERTPESLVLNGASALKPSKKQADVAALFGDFATWQRTRVFDADLTARFGAATDGDRKRLLEQLLGLEKLDEGLRRCREDKREAEHAAALTPEPQHPGEAPAHDGAELGRVSELLADVERRAAKMAKDEGRYDAELRAAEHRTALFQHGRCPTCEQPVPDAYRSAARDAEIEARKLRAQSAAARRAAVEEGAKLLAEAQRLRAQQQAAERWVEKRRLYERDLERWQGERLEQSEAQRKIRLLAETERFIVEARPKLLRSSLAILEAAASAWLPGLHIGEDGALRHGARSYKELNEGHRRLCDMAVLLGLSSMGDAKVKGPIWLEGSLFGGLDEERSEAVISLFERVAERELIIVLTCSEDVAQRMRGIKVKVVDGAIR